MAKRRWIVRSHNNEHGQRRHWLIDTKPKGGELIYAEFWTASHARRVARLLNAEAGDA